MKRISQKRLWEAQVREYPSSVRMTIEEVYKWCDENRSAEERLLRWTGVALALQYPNVVFYYVKGFTHNPKRIYRGFRFGLHGSEYMSIYSN